MRVRLVLPFDHITPLERNGHALRALRKRCPPQKNFCPAALSDQRKTTPAGRQTAARARIGRDDASQSPLLARGAANSIPMMRET